MKNCGDYLIYIRDKSYYYLFKNFLVSDWLAANCEIVISTHTKDTFI